jgi:lysophospholipase L1-like esterase
MMRRLARFRLGLAVIAALLALGAGTAVARPLPVEPPPAVAIGRVGVGAPVDGPVDGGGSLLVPVHYPIQLAGRTTRLTVSLLGSSGGKIRSWRLKERLSSDHKRRPEKRRRFTYVHHVDLGRALTRRVRRGARVKVTVQGLLDANRDGKAEYRSRDTSAQALPRAGSGGGLCSDVPGVRVRPGRTVVVDLPVCEENREWDFLGRPERGRASIKDGRLTYRPPAKFRGTQAIELVGLLDFAGASRSELEPLVFAEFPVTVSAADEGVAVRALGDSVTAGFGYYSNGTPMTIGRLLECRPAAKGYNDACSSNSLNTTSAKGKLEYAPDYGLANDISWAAQWSNEHGVTDYANYAVSGSEPSDWAPGGELHAATERIEAEDPDYVLMTMGANPLLSNMLFGVDNMGCAIYADVFGGYRECIEEAFAEVHLQAGLQSLYTDLVQHTRATIYLMQYHLSVPSTALAYNATQIAEMGKLLNREIATVAAAVNPQRLQVVAPPHFNVGIDISPVYPSRFSCSELGYKVDGPSVQSNPTQEELAILHPLSFCEGPNGEASPPWVIGGDTGIHPSATGYGEMASQVPAPG